MSRVLLLMLFMLWMTWLPNRGNEASAAVVRAGIGVPVFLGGLAALVLGMGLWSRRLARQAGTRALHRRLGWFNKAMASARVAIPMWFAVGLFALGWGHVVVRLLGPVDKWDVELPGLVLGTLPAVLAWMGLWWSQFPTERALREQAMVIQLEASAPVHAPPGFWRLFMANLRLQVLFTLVPVVLIVLIRDVAAGALRAMGVWPRRPQTAEVLVSIGAAAAIFLYAPEILRRVLHTQRLPDSSLRTRLENLCRRHKLRYRDILLWHTEGHMGNAAVMGIVPGVRYVLLSDVLLETMSDQQIEAVFAHELGHIVHRHMLWYVVFIVAMLLGLGVVETAVGPWLEEAIAWLAAEWLTAELALLVVGVGGFVLLFGYLSRRLERQADVFAARTMEQEGSGFRLQGSVGMLQGSGVPVRGSGAGLGLTVASPAAAGTVAQTTKERSHVGPAGASLFASALYRVAVINNIPASARSWCHGSIAKRMAYLRHLSEDPMRTHRFDRRMRRMYAVLVAALMVTAAAAVVQAWVG